MIKRNIVEHIEIFISVTAMNIHSGHTLSAFGDPRLCLQRLDHISFPEKNRRVTHFVGTYFLSSDFRCFHRRGFKAGDNHHLIKHSGFYRGFIN